MGCFYQSDPTRRGYQKRMIAIWKEIVTFEIREQKLVIKRERERESLEQING